MDWRKSGSGWNVLISDKNQMNKLRFDSKRCGEWRQESAQNSQGGGKLKSLTPGISAFRFEKLV